MNGITLRVDVHRRHARIARPRDRLHGGGDHLRRCRTASAAPAPIVSTTVEQFGFVTICPFQPRSRCCRGTIFRCSRVDLGHQQRHVLLHPVVLRIRDHDVPGARRTRARFRWRRYASMAENINRGALSFGSDSSTVRSATRAGMLSVQAPRRRLAVLLACRTIARARPRSARTTGGPQGTSRNAGPPCRWRRVLPLRIFGCI